jgi:hypothetical protein
MLQFGYKEGNIFVMVADYEMCEYYVGYGSRSDGSSVNDCEVLDDLRRWRGRC